MLTREKAEARVSAGIAFLNEQEPHYGELKNWPMKIDPVDLDLGEPQSCVIGQTFGGFRVGARALELESFMAVSLGFDIPQKVTDVEREYRLLTEVWREKLQQLQAERRHQV